MSWTTDLPLYGVAARAFATTRWRARTLRERGAIARHQRSQLATLTSYAARAFTYYAQSVGRPFSDWPILDKSGMVANFDGLNLGHFPAAVLRAELAAGRERLGGYVIGHSTGTSGNRGYYLISDAERFVWLGTLLAKALPDALWRRHRVALVLPGLSSLYRSAGSASRIQLGFFDLAQGIGAWADDLDRFAPDTIVAPPKVLRLLAERGGLEASHIFSGAEVLDPLDRAVIERLTRRTVREIYMATEGLFGVSCPHGTLHLAEDVVHFEWETPVAGSTLRAPIVTDFTRRSQAMIRYRMNDLLELDPTPCACGSPFQPVRQIAGRADDVLSLTATSGASVAVTPDVLRNAVVDADPAIQDFRILQTGPTAIEVRLSPGLAPEVEDRVRSKVEDRLRPFGVEPTITIRRGLDVPFDHKLRRVRSLGR